MQYATRWLKVSALLAALCIIIAPAVIADEPVEVLIFFSPTCGHCGEFRETVWPDIETAYADAIVASFIDISTPEGLQRLEAEEERIGSRAPDVPAIVVGDQLLFAFTPDELGELLTAAIEQTLAGGDPTASTGQPASQTPVTTTPAPTDSAGGPPIRLAYVEKDGCSECQRAAIVLEVIQNDYPQLVVTTFNSMHDADLLEAMGVYLDLPEQDRLIAPAIYVGGDVLVDDEIVSGALREILDTYVADGAPAFWKDLSADTGASSILGRFREMGPLTVIGAALIDGINPCAFATILFFVSYLAIGKRTRKEMLVNGLAFTLGVFVTYLLVGIGAMKLLELATAIQVLRPILYGVMGAACLILGGLSVHDYVLARRGQASEMQLNLPDKLRNRIKSQIRTTRGALAGTALVTGLVVSLLELACTGQVYLPTISFVVGMPEMRLSALLYLVLYNIAFVIPLLVVLMLSVFGVSAQGVQRWFAKNLAKSKLLMAILFLLLGVLLLLQVI